MSKRAEEAALKAYPVDICGYTVECRVGAKPQPQDWNEIRRTYFQEGYEQSEKDTIDRACKWLEENVVIYPYGKPLCIINLDTFRKEMEGEQ